MTTLQKLLPYVDDGLINLADIDDYTSHTPFIVCTKTFQTHIKDCDNCPFNTKENSDKAICLSIADYSDTINPTEFAELRVTHPEYFL